MPLAKREQTAPTDKDERTLFLEESPVTKFLEFHEKSGTPNEMTIAGAGDCHVKLGDLRAFVRALK